MAISPIRSEAIPMSETSPVMSSSTEPEDSGRRRGSLFEADDGRAPVAKGVKKDRGAWYTVGAWSTGQGPGDVAQLVRVLDS